MVQRHKNCGGIVKILRTSDLGYSKCWKCGLTGDFLTEILVRGENGLKIAYESDTYESE